MSEYAKMFLIAENFFIFFDGRKAQEKAKEIQAIGKKAEVFREGERWIVFKLAKFVDSVIIK